MFEKKSYRNTIFILILIFTGFVQALPAIFGGRGLFKVEDAITEDIGVVSVSTYLLGDKVSGIYYGDWIAPNITYTPSRYGEVFFWTGRIITSNLEFPQIWNSSFHSTPHDKMVGGKLSFPNLPVFKIGGEIAYAWPRSTYTGSVIETKKGLNWTGLMSARFSEFYGALPNLILNYGENPYVRNYGAGFELAGGGGAIFVEATSYNLKPSGIFEHVLDNLTITPGFKLNTGQYSCFSGGVIINVKRTSTIPDYTAVIGLTIGGAILKPPQPKLGILTGTVTDGQTGASLPATLSFPDNPKNKPIQTNPQTGIFKVEKLPAGIVVVEVSSDGYQKLTTSLGIEVNKINAFDIKLKTLMSYGIIAGNVYDIATKKPLEADITFSDSTLLELKSDSLTGSFKVEKIVTGVITVIAQKEGYFPKSITINVEEGKVTQVDLPIASSILKGIFTGKISDNTTKKPIQGTVTLTGTAISPLVSDSLTGIFQSEMPVGTYSVSVTADGYLPATGIITIEKDGHTQSDFELIPSELKTIMTGKVSDKKTGDGLKAIINFPEVGIAPINTDSLTGVYRAEIPVGSYLVEVKSEGYITQTTMVVLEQGQVLEKSFELVKKGMLITLKGIYFESGKATLRPESYAVLQDAAKILTDNPKIKVEIQGHTDNIGSEAFNQTLSEKRAYAVIDYLVKTLGIAPERLVAKGYGDTKPIASNETQEGRALNRRVDFVILQQE
jgi:outer membrane protein OmpA-like peptidoglycan-associated protein